MATNRQVPNCKVGLQHNIGLGGAAVVGIYRLGFPEKFKPFPKDKPNPAIDSDTLKLHTPAPAAAGGNASDLKSAKVFDGLKAKIAADPTLVSKVNAVYKFDVKGPNGAITSWIVDLKNGSGSVTQVSITYISLYLYIIECEKNVGFELMIFIGFKPIVTTDSTLFTFKYAIEYEL